MHALFAAAFFHPEGACLLRRSIDLTHTPSRCPLLLLDAGGNLEAWQLASLAQRFGDRLFRVTKPFLTGGGLAAWLASAEEKPAPYRQAHELRLPRPPCHRCCCYGLQATSACASAQYKCCHALPSWRCRCCRPHLLMPQLHKPASMLPAAAAGRTRMRLEDYSAYCQQQHDEEPLYIFDA